MTDVLCGRAATLSKGSEFWGKDFQPSYLLNGVDAHVTGNDGRLYLDWVSGLGAVLLGVGHTRFCERVCNQVWLGAGFSLSHYLEQQVAEKLVALLGAHVPGWQPEGLSARFGLSGSDACAMAVRLARAVTGRQWIVSVGYHGWSSEFVAATPPAWGVVPQPVTAAPFGDLVALEGALGTQLQAGSWRTVASDLAAVIIEQPPQQEPPGYWQEVRRLCAEHGALLIVDEVVTGFRFALGGAAEYHGITPDIVCVGKALGNGIPISGMVFPREYASWFARNDPVFVSSTAFGNAVSLAAADAVLDLWDEHGVNHIWGIGQALMDGLRDAGYEVVGYPPVSLLKFGSKAERAFFIAGMRDRGILINRPQIPNLAHTLADVRATVQAAAEVKAEMQAIDVEQVMAGRLPQQLFEGR